MAVTSPSPPPRHDTHPPTRRLSNSRFNWLVQICNHPNALPGRPIASLLTVRSVRPDPPATARCRPRATTTTTTTNPNSFSPPVSVCVCHSHLLLTHPLTSRAFQFQLWPSTDHLHFGVHGTSTRESVPLRS